jgi:hypothetical protein|tara:strand:- start:82 stop:285 length:204 start_codon:yes stop_codon:yes gene_type:complete
VKNFKEIREEIAGNNTGEVALPPTAMNMKNRKSQVLTRHYIEVNGKRKKLIKGGKFSGTGGIDNSPL